MKKISLLLYIASLILVIAGFIVMFVYGDYDEKYNRFGSKIGHIVGGDAYNFIIIGIRGVGLIITGFITTVVASTFLIVDTIKEQMKRMVMINESLDSEP